MTADDEEVMRIARAMARIQEREREDRKPPLLARAAEGAKQAAAVWAVLALVASGLAALFGDVATAKLRDWSGSAAILERLEATSAVAREERAAIRASVEEVDARLTGRLDAQETQIRTLSGQDGVIQARDGSAREPVREGDAVIYLDFWARRTPGMEPCQLVSEGIEFTGPAIRPTEGRVLSEPLLLTTAYEEYTLDVELEAPLPPGRVFADRVALYDDCPGVGRVRDRERIAEFVVRPLGDRGALLPLAAPLIVPTRAD